MRLAPSYIWYYGQPDHTMMYEVSDLTHASKAIHAVITYYV